MASVCMTTCTFRLLKSQDNLKVTWQEFSPKVSRIITFRTLSIYHWRQYVHVPHPNNISSQHMICYLKTVEWMVNIASLSHFQQHFQQLQTLYSYRFSHMGKWNLLAFLTHRGNLYLSLEHLLICNLGHWSSICRCFHLQRSHSHTISLNNWLANLQ